MANKIPKPMKKERYSSDWRYSNTSNTRWRWAQHNPARIEPGVSWNDIPYGGDITTPDVGSQQAANGGQSGPPTLNASDGPKVTPQDRASSISAPVKGGNFLRKHGLG